MTHNQVTFQLGKREQDIKQQEVDVSREGVGVRRDELRESKRVSDYNMKSNNTAIAATVVTVIVSTIISSVIAGLFA